MRGSLKKPPQMTQSTEHGKGPWQSHLDTALRAVEKAGRLQIDALGRPRAVVFKSARDPVTDVDRACEDAVVRIIRRRFPSHDFLLEETPTARTGSPYLWVVDPLDGTANYAKGFPHFCCSIALQHQDETVLGVVRDPVRKELFTAVRGNGAFLNGMPIHVSEEKRLVRSLLATGFPKNMLEAQDTNVDKFIRMTPHVQTIRRSGSAVLDLCYVASGRLDGYWVVQTAPWDTAAGVLFVEEAGGRVTNLSGEPHGNQGSRLLATNGRIHDPVLDLLGESP